MNLDLFYCQNCGKIIAVVKNSNSPTICCSNQMKQLHSTPSENLLEHDSKRFNETINHTVPIINIKGRTISVTLGSKLSNNKKISPSHQLDWILIQSGILNNTQKNPAFSQVSTPQNLSSEFDFAVMSGERFDAEFSLF